MTTHIYTPGIYPCRDNKWASIEEAVGANTIRPELSKNVVSVMCDHHLVNDADVCGDEDYYAVTTEDFKTFKFHKVSHSWWMEYSPEWEIHNIFDYEEVDSVPFTFPTAIRDWIIL